MNDKLQRIRARIREIQDEIARLTSGEILVPLTMATARLDEQLNAMRAGSDDHLRRMVTGLAQNTQGRLEIAEDRQSRDGVQRLMVSIDYDRIRAHLLALLKATYANGPEALSASEITKRIDKLKIEQAKCEREDFDLAEQLGIPQRPDQNPGLLLGLDRSTSQ